MNAEKVTQTINGKVSWVVAGHFFKMLETVNAVTVELFRGGERVLIAQSIEAGFYQYIAFDRVEITTGAAEAISWMYAPDKGGSDRFVGSVVVTSGNINVYEAGTVRTLAGKNFAWQMAYGATAGQYTHIQLFNPAASGKNAYVEKLQYGLGGNGHFLVGYTNAALAGASTAVVNKLNAAGAAAGVCLGYSESNVGNLITTRIFSEYALAGTPHEFDLRAAPIVLAPGRGLVMMPNVVNTAFYGTFEFYEEAE